MAERDPSELDLAVAFRAYLEDAATQVSPTELARQVATTYPHRRTWFGRWGFGLTPAIAWLLLALGLLLALAVGGLAAGALRQGRTTGIEVLPPHPGWYTRVVAVSRDELWTTSGWAVWHFRDGHWSTVDVDRGSWGYPTLAPDGTLWAAGADGVAHWRDGRWVVADAHPASAITVDREGTVWVAGTGRGCDIWALRSSGTTWTRTSVECPFSFGGGGAVTSMAVDGRGALWVGAGGFVVNALARYADGRWEATEARAGLPSDVGVTVLGVSATGDVWIDFNSGSHQLARFDGTAWIVNPTSGGPYRAVAVAPDGPLWASALARYDGLGWAHPYPGIALPLTPLAVAPDGTVFAVDGDGSLVRLPAP